MGLKVIHIISSLRRGGRERQLATIVSQTDPNQYPSKIIVFNDTQSSYIDEYGLEEKAIFLKVKGKIARLKMLHQILKKETPDIVFTWGNGESVSILLLKPFHRFVFINGSVRHGIRSRQVSHYLRTLILHLSRHVMANSYAGLKANNLKRGFVLYNGIDEKFLHPLADRAAIRQKLVGLPENTLIFASVANLVPYKDYYTVINALESIKRQGADFHYLILGDGPLREKIEDLIKRTGLEKNVTILGNVVNVHEYLKISDIFIHSSKGEGCSNAILEAMAAGLPVIASDTGGTSEIVSQGNGFLFDYQNVTELAKLLAYVHNNPDKCRVLGINSRSIIEERFLIPTMMNNYYKIIRDVLGK